MVDQGGIEGHHQAFARRHARRFFECLRLDRQLVVGLHGIDEVDAFAEGFIGDSAKEGEHAHVTGSNAGHGSEEQDYDQERGHAQADQAQKGAGLVSGINHSGPSGIKDCHRYSPHGDFRNWGARRISALRESGLQGWAGIQGAGLRD